MLDIGFGTGTLAARLYQHGCVIFGQDFSARMLEAASAKMPKAQLYQGDFSRGLVPQLQGQTFDFITATYSLHHLTLEGKRDFLAQLRRQLAPEGEILIGDVAFRTQAELEACRKAAGRLGMRKKFISFWKNCFRFSPICAMKRFRTVRP